MSRSPLCRSPSDVLQGTLDLLILKTLSRESLHGWGLAKRMLRVVERRDCRSSRDRSIRRCTASNSRAGSRPHGKTPSWAAARSSTPLTRDGRQQLERELDSWKRLSSAVGLLLKNA